MCRTCFSALNYYTMVYKSLRNKIPVHLRNSLFGFRAMNLCVKWHHLLAALLARFLIMSELLSNPVLSASVCRRRDKLDGDTSLMTYRGHGVLHTLVRSRFSPQHTTGQRYIYTGCATGAIISESSSRPLIFVCRNTTQGLL